MTDYLLELSFDDYENPPWNEVLYPANTKEAKSIIEKLKKSDKDFRHGTLYDVKEIDMDG